MEKRGEQYNEKAEKINEIFRIRPDAIFVLSAGIIPIETPRGDAQYKTTAYSDVDHKGFLGGGKARIIAAAEASSFFPEAPLVTDSYSAQKSGEEPTHAEVMAEELQHYGVPKERIIKEERSVDTITELVEMIKLAALHKWHNIAVVSNAYHIPRIQEMYRQLDTLASKDDTDFGAAMKEVAQNPIEISFVSAEDILPIRSEHYVKLIEEMENTSAFKNRVAAEEQGLKQLREGTYGKR
jgi:DUF218 domain